ncbi:hypothetical protein HYH03_001545 [Edaphochlamys debaryana]|uniref:Phosphoribulokinase, chloroplastic n=1 Tax=Edaphochlamys debaryana TaxID=47281 RepID=A0A835YGH5_9CHLO|nr:hypothetical protein HYH03_001545 [Edaphochlamys debaryana]|eukprot:KAG2500783.1 hypothetical protein HYH03_001545 [Edaphochlamys debaryana]
MLTHSVSVAAPSRRRPVQCAPSHVGAHVSIPSRQVASARGTIRRPTAVLVFAGSNGNGNGNGHSNGNGNGNGADVDEADTCACRLDGVNCPVVRVTTPIIFALGADSGCGKTTFMRRLSAIVSGCAPKLLPGGHPNTNTLVAGPMTVICLDDYHKYDRKGRALHNVTALASECQDFDLMYQQVKDLKEGRAVHKPVYDHATGTLDPPERVEPPEVLGLEGLHPLVDPRVRDLVDLAVYVDVATEIKVAWKIGRDVAERGHSVAEVVSSITKRLLDFRKAVEPQRELADLVIQILPSELAKEQAAAREAALRDAAAHGAAAAAQAAGESAEAVAAVAAAAAAAVPAVPVTPPGCPPRLRVRLIQVLREKPGGARVWKPVHVLEESSEVQWKPYNGIRIRYGSEDWYGNPARVLEVDGQLGQLSDLLPIERHLRATGCCYEGEVARTLLDTGALPGSDDGSGLVAALVALKVRQIHEQRRLKLAREEREVAARKAAEERKAERAAARAAAAAAGPGAAANNIVMWEDALASAAELWDSWEDKVTWRR